MHLKSLNPKTVTLPKQRLLTVGKVYKLLTAIISPSRCGITYKNCRLPGPVA